MLHTFNRAVFILALRGLHGTTTREARATTGTQVMHGFVKTRSSN
jgi:hypothetical protein